MIELFVSALVTFFVVIDPPGCIPIYAGMTRGASDIQHRAMAVRAIATAALILFIFAVFGEKLLHALGVGLDAFRIAGGIMLFLIALEMVFEKRTQRRESRVRAVNETQEIEDISIFPMAIPMIAGPGAIASAMLLMARSDGLMESLVVMSAMGAVLLLLLIGLLLSHPLMNLLGDKIEAAVTRILGVVLAALAAQFVVDGLKASFATTDSLVLLQGLADTLAKGYA